MQPFYTEKEFNQTKSRDTLKLLCYECNTIFPQVKREITYELKHQRGRCRFCSRGCWYQNQKTCLELKCKECNKEFTRNKSQIKKTKNSFCSRSCAATYNNTHKTKGTRRSKLEVYLEKRLTEIYPNLEILYSDKKAINSELDFYFPLLKLAFELNGIFHYEPIFGESKLDQIQNNDHRKFQACLEQGIELCIIDSSGQKYFKESTSQKYLDIITNLVNSKIESSI